MTGSDDFSISTRISLGDLLVILTTLVFSSDLVELTFRGIGLGAVVQVFYLGIYAMSLLVAILTGTLSGLARTCPLALLMIALPVLSMAWSFDPNETLQRVIGLVGTSIFGFYLGWHYTTARLIRLVTWGMIVNVTLSLIAIVAVPAIGIDHSQQWSGTWIGIHTHKNELGGSMSLVILLLAYALFDTGGPLRFVFWTYLGLSVLLLAGSSSATSILTTAISLALMSIFVIWAKAPGLARLLMLLSVVFVPFFAFLAWYADLFDLVLEAFGKDSNLSSRVDIWRLVWPYVGDRWWLGYGYGVFWQENLPWMNQMEERLHFAPFYSHNGIIETWIGGGIILVIVTVSVYLLGLFKAFVRVAGEPEVITASFPIVMLLVFITRNITESALLNRNNIFWALFVAMIATLARDVRLRLGSGTIEPVEG
ncbi:MAG: O-antigen ligase family protein [Geminicoccaceae bacterium]|nr:O-antigen ligase family protein [Geminicoccaceae bacterium]